MSIADTNNYGSVEIAVISNVDTDKFRARVKYLLRGGAPQVCVINPPSHGGHMPVDGEVCLVYRAGKFYARYLLPLGQPLSMSERSLEDRITIGEENVGDIPKLLPGESFIGQRGKIHFNSVGSVEMFTPTSGQRLSLNNSTNQVRVDAHNYTLSTMGSGIQIRTVSSVDTAFGDTLRLEKNVPASLLPPELSSPLPPTNLSLIQMDAMGGITASVAEGAQLRLSETGGVDLSNPLGSLDISEDGAVSVFSTNNVSIEGQLKVTVSGIKPGGFNVLLNPNLTAATQFGVARVGDQVTSNSTVDATYWTYLSQLHAALQALSTAIQGAVIAPLDGGAALKTAMVTSLTAPLTALPTTLPTKFYSQITKGSKSVTAGD